MADAYNRRATADLVLDRSAVEFGARRIETRGRLIEQKDVGSARESLSEERSLPLPARKGGERMPRERCHVESSHRVIHGLPVCAREAT